MENIAVILIIGAAALYVVGYFYKRVRNKGSGCGCSNASCKAAGTSKGPKSSLPCCKE